MPDKLKINIQIHHEELPLLLPTIKESDGLIDISCPGGIYLQVGGSSPFPSIDWEEGLFGLFVGWLDNLRKLESDHQQDFYFMNGRELMTTVLDPVTGIVRVGFCDYDFEEYAVRDAEVDFSQFQGEIIQNAIRVKDAVLSVDPDLDTELMRIMYRQLDELHSP